MNHEDKNSLKKKKHRKNLVTKKSNDNLFTT